jgi:hypothetical protein
MEIVGDQLDDLVLESLLSGIGIGQAVRVGADTKRLLIGLRFPGPESA